MKILRLGWDDFDLAVTSIYRQMTTKLIPGELDTIYGMPRGGMPLAVALSHRARLPVWDDYFPLSSKTMWIDDIFDSGSTYRKNFMSSFSKHAAVWVVRAQEKLPTDLFYVQVVPHDVWVLFPWEDPEQAREDWLAHQRQRGR